MTFGCKSFLSTGQLEHYFRLSGACFGCPRQTKEQPKFWTLAVSCNNLVTINMLDMSLWLDLFLSTVHKFRFLVREAIKLEEFQRVGLWHLRTTYSTRFRPFTFQPLFLVKITFAVFVVESMWGKCNIGWDKLSIWTYSISGAELTLSQLPVLFCFVFFFCLSS